MSHNVSAKEPRRWRLRAALAAATLAGSLMATGASAIPDGRAASATAASPEGEYRFSVWYNDRKIGRHQFDVRRDGDALRVSSSARFEFKLLFVPVYQYRHQAQEQWRDGCLTYLESETDDNGQRYRIRATAMADRLTLERATPEPETDEVGESCAASYAYWDLDRLRRSQLINSQTGELTPVTLEAVGRDVVDGVPADKYVLTAEGVGTIELWYRQSDGRWIQLRTNRDGGTLTYRSEA